MSIADESTVPHRPPQVGDRVEVRLQGEVTEVRDEDGTAWVRVHLDDGRVSCNRTIWDQAERVAILRDIPRYQPGHADHPE